MIDYDFSKGWKPYEWEKIPADLDIPEDVKHHLVKTSDGVHLAGSFRAAEFLEKNGAIPLGWKVYEGGMITCEIPKGILDSNMLKVRERNGKQVLLVAPEAFWFVESCGYSVAK